MKAALALYVYLRHAAFFLSSSSFPLSLSFLLRCAAKAQKTAPSRRYVCGKLHARIIPQRSNAPICVICVSGGERKTHVKLVSRTTSSYQPEFTSLYGSISPRYLASAAVGLLYQRATCANCNSLRIPCFCCYTYTERETCNELVRGDDKPRLRVMFLLRQINHLFRRRITGHCD